MSYCRWSSDDYQCDVYVYEDISGGWTTHVACKRPVYEAELPPVVPFTPDNLQAWDERHGVVIQMLESAECPAIGLSRDGQSFSDSTPGECADRLVSLRDEGYNVPQYAIDALREEETERP